MVDSHFIYSLIIIVIEVNTKNFRTDTDRFNDVVSTAEHRGTGGKLVLANCRTCLLVVVLLVGLRGWGVERDFFSDGQGVLMTIAMVRGFFKWLNRELLRETGE